jgi:hypothetical protein
MTTKAKDEDKAELYRYTSFKLNDITYVPHYRDTKRYVGPGYPRHTNATFTASDLFSAGAVPTISFLWKRSEFGILKAGKIG